MAARKGDGEKVKANLIDEKKLTTIMKRFLGTKVSDPEESKYYRIEDGINFMATTFGSAVQLLFFNKHAGTFTKGTGKNFFRKPLPKEQYEDVDFIPEIETIKDGNKNIKKPTGRIIEYPDIPGMFDRYNLNEFQVFELPVDDIVDFIAIHKAMGVAAKIGGMYNTAQMSVHKNGINIKLYDSPLTFEWTYKMEQDEDFDFYLKEYHYDFSLMTSIFESIKDLSVDKVQMYIKDIDNPIFFFGTTVEYSFRFAIKRKLVLNSGNEAGS